MIGMGLIGGSMVRALAAAGHRVLGYDADPAVRATARTAAARVPSTARWQVTANVRDAVAPASLVVVAVPLPAVPRVLDELAGAGYTGLVTDVTSVKGPVQMLVDQRLHRRHNRLAGFVGGHPMAGRETSGFDASDEPTCSTAAPGCCASRPASRRCPTGSTLAELVTSLGARAVPATAEEHDRAVAAISHVPHLLAAALADLTADDPLAAALGAGSFRDGTRVAATRPELIAAMCGGNAAATPGRAGRPCGRHSTTRGRRSTTPDPITALPLVVRARPRRPGRLAAAARQAAGHPRPAGRPAAARAGRRLGDRRRPDRQTVTSGPPGRTTRTSVTIAVTRSCGVTSNAGLTARHAGDHLGAVAVFDLHVGTRRRRGVHRGLRRDHHERDAGAARRRAHARTCRSC